MTHAHTRDVYREMAAHGKQSMSQRKLEDEEPKHKMKWKRERLIIAESGYYRLAVSTPLVS